MSTLSREDIVKKVRRQLRKREQLPARDLAARAGLTTKTIARAIKQLVDDGEVVVHKGPGGGDRAPRYTKV